jgi:hypothetical protein
MTIIVEEFMNKILISIIASASVSLPVISLAGTRHVTMRGVVYDRDSSNAALGEAYRNQKVIWGDVLKDDQHGPLRLNYESAEKYCESIGARLPNFDSDILNLVSDLKYKKGRVGFYSAYSDPQYENGETTVEVLPNLVFHQIWVKDKTYNGFQSERWGYLMGKIDKNDLYEVRCVVDVQ